MATSGTIGTTTINTATLIEHALLRVRVSPTDQTPEMIKWAKDNLYILLLNLSNRGLNMWCVDRGYIGLTAGKATYDTPQGTLDILNVVHSQPTLPAVTVSAIVDGSEAQLDAGAQAIVRIGFYLNAAFTGVLNLARSSDGITYTTVSALPSTTYQADTWYYADLPGSQTYEYFSVTGTAAPVTNIRLITVSADLPLTIWNRDTFAAINNKTQTGHPATNYFFEKKIPPAITLWPVPDLDTNYIMFYRHRQVQDVGSLTQEVEIPARWIEGVIWQLALRLAFELPQVSPDLLTLLTQMADRYEFEAEASETDGAPIYLTPGIGVYTR